MLASRTRVVCYNKVLKASLNVVRVGSEGGDQRHSMTAWFALPPTMNSDGPADTDTLLALLCSLLPDNVAPSQQTLLEALLQTEGDVKMAAGVILKERTNRKRKRNTSLDSWLTRSDSATQDERLSSLPSGSGGPSHDQLLVASDWSPQKKPRSEGSATSATTKKDQPPFSKPVKPVKNLLEVLRPQPPQASATANAPRLPPLTLSNPSLVTQHTPCTLHLGVLPPELASRLFYTMLHEAQDWTKNKWWLFDRLVESSHRASLYTRHLPEAGNEAAWQKITRAW